MLPVTRVYLVTLGLHFTFVITVVTVVTPHVLVVTHCVHRSCVVVPCLVPFGSRVLLIRLRSLVGYTHVYGCLPRTVYLRVYVFYLYGWFCYALYRTFTVLRVAFVCCLLTCALVYYRWIAGAHLPPAVAVHYLCCYTRLVVWIPTFTAVTRLVVLLRLPCRTALLITTFTAPL